MEILSDFLPESVLTEYLLNTLPFCVANCSRWSEDGMDFLQQRLVEKVLSMYNDNEQVRRVPARVVKTEPKKDQTDFNELFKINAKGFGPDEVCVKIKDRTVSIFGRHEEGKPDEKNYVLRELHEEFQIPPGTDPNIVTCEMESDGMMFFLAPSSEDTANCEQS